MVADTGDAVGDRHACQVGATPERRVPDAGDAVGYSVATGYAPWALDERGPALIEQDSIQTTIAGIVSIHRDCPEPGTARERSAPNAGDAVANRDANQVGAGRERYVPDVCDAVGDRVATGFARRVLDEHGLALVKQDPIHTAIVRIERNHCDCRQSGAARERIVPDAGNAIPYRDVGEAGTKKERSFPEAVGAVANRDAGQAGTAREHIVSDVSNAVRDRD